jgi:hypothetical protein
MNGGPLTRALQTERGMIKLMPCSEKSIEAEHARVSRGLRRVVFSVTKLPNASGVLTFVVDVQAPGGGILPYWATSGPHLDSHLGHNVMWAHLG